MANPVIEKIDNPKSPAGLFDALRNYPYIFFLDSALQDKRLGRFSFLGCEPFLIFKSKGDYILLEYSDGRRESFKANPFLALKDIFIKYRYENSGETLPFTSGGVGYFSYDMKDFIEDLPDIAADDLDLPDCVMGFYDVVIIYDHLKNAAYIASSGLPYSGTKGALRRSERLNEFKDRVKWDGSIYSARFTNKIEPSHFITPDKLMSNFSKSGYINTIKKAKQYIRKGDIYQVNISQRFAAPLRMEPPRLYSRLRAVSPAPFASYLGFEDAAILSSSPERFLLKRGRYIETRPIKGTRPRGKNRQSDLLLEHELKRSAKDNAEHIMIVDLERNDLGRICDYGSIMQNESAAVEKYANVSHLVSTVSGRLKKGRGPIDCLLAAFPGGSITGAPKVRSMEIIEELEPVKRSIYTGAIGYISFGGNMDTSIAIRTIVVKGGKVYFSAGGGIVADSDPEAEYQETLDKAAGIIKALGLGTGRAHLSVPYCCGRV